MSSILGISLSFILICVTFFMLTKDISSVYEQFSDALFSLVPMTIWRFRWKEWFWKKKYKIDGNEYENHKKNVKKKQFVQVRTYRIIWMPYCHSFIIGAIFVSIRSFVRSYLLWLLTVAIFYICIIDNMCKSSTSFAIASRLYDNVL